MEYKKNVAGNGCDQCPIGQDSTDGLNCVGCNAGYSKPDQTFATCLKCPDGSSCGGSAVICQAGYYFDTSAQCKKNDTYFSLFQTATQSVSTVTSFVSVTVTQTSVSVSFATATVYAPTQFQTNTVTALPPAQPTQTVSIMNSVTLPAQSVTVTPAGITAPQTQAIVSYQSIIVTTPVTQTETVTVGQTVTLDASGTPGLPPAALAQSANSVTLDFIGTLPISPLIFGAVCLGIGVFVTLIFSLVCCRKTQSRRKDDDFEAMATTGMNTTSQRTFTHTANR